MRVVLADVSIPFWSLVWFLVELAVAAIPALLFLWLVGLLLMALSAGCLQALS